MNFLKSVFLAGGAIALLSTFTACSSASNGDDGSSTDDQTADELRKKHPDFYSCNTDTDCVAVPRVGCCHNGWEEAVNRHHVTAYEHSFTCSHPQICPMYMVDDTRQPECNLSTGKCEMVAIDDISCGGFTMNPHACPSGYDCVMNKPYVPDMPGHCEPADAGGGDDAGPGDDASDDSATDAGTPDSHVCVQNVMCTRLSHWDSTLCQCVKNPMCGGFAGLACPSGYSSCIDDPTDGCDPAAGGADCPGVCVP